MFYYVIDHCNWCTAVEYIIIINIIMNILEYYQGNTKPKPHPCKLDILCLFPKFSTTSIEIILAEVNVNGTANIKVMLTLKLN